MLGLTKKQVVDLNNGKSLNLLCDNQRCIILKKESILWMDDVIGGDC